LAQNQTDPDVSCAVIHSPSADYLAAEVSVSIGMGAAPPALPRQGISNQAPTGLG